MTDDPTTEAITEATRSFFGDWLPDESQAEDEAPPRPQRAQVGPTKAELRSLFDPYRTPVLPECEEENRLLLAQLEKAGLKPKNIVVANGGWAPKRRKKASEATEAADSSASSIFD